MIFGSGIGGLTTIQEQIIKMHDKGPKRVSPMFVPMAISNMAAGNIAIRFNAQNMCSAVVTACASGTNAIGDAYRQVKEGRAQVMITGGSEASVNEIGIAGFAALTALSTTEDPLKASKPFDVDRNGFVLGEGAPPWCSKASNTPRLVGQRSSVKLLVTGRRGMPTTSPHRILRGRAPRGLCNRRLTKLELRQPKSHTLTLTGRLPTQRLW